MGLKFVYKICLGFVLRWFNSYLRIFRAGLFVFFCWHVLHVGAWISHVHGACDTLVYGWLQD